MARDDQATRNASVGAGDVAPTVSADSQAAPVQSAHEFPVQNWDRYQFVAYLGGGGMGRVFKAFDPRLGRPVALKFLRDDDPKHMERLMREARAQANVDHERVCKVYEVGEVEGKPFIAMQFIDGAPLREAAREMTLEQKLLVMREVALGLHEAHRTGLIHRDVKPGNIMVERTESGEFKPFVMDFGLARKPDSAALTMAGAVVGTPYYMPPEQARGEAADRRSDIYGLGATLYEILTNRPPFDGDSPTAVLVKVLDEIPESPRRTDRAIPVDVEAITMKCLRHDPHERYPSARALADDIQRYLDGLPVEARPTGILYRLRMRARRNKAAVAVVAVAGVLLVSSVIWGVSTEWAAARRARLAQDFGQQVERIEALARYAYTVPLHDVRQQWSRIRDQMVQIQQRTSEMGGIAKGPGHYALGRAQLALGDYDAARRELEVAWQAGYREPQVAYALGRVFGQIYSNALQEAEQLQSEPERAARKKQIEEAYRRPALEYLEQSRALETESPEFVEALIAHYEGRQAEALVKARQVYERLPWMYEARQLEGEIYSTLANEKSDQGDYDGADENYRQAEAAYRAAIVVGQSDPAVYASLCGLERTRMAMEIRGRGRDLAPFFQEGVAACDSALRANPEDVEALVLKAGLYVRMGEQRLNRGEDPQADLRRAIETAQTAVEMRPAHLVAHSNIGVAHRFLAKHESNHGGDPVADLTAAIAAHQRALEISPESFVDWNNIGVDYKEKADYERRHGVDPSASWEMAVSSYEHSLAIRPDQVPANVNLAVTLYQLAGGAPDPEPLLQRAVQALDRALKINPRQLVAHYQLGRIQGLRAEKLSQRGEDPRALLQNAIAEYRRALEIGPESPYRGEFRNGLARCFYLQAVYERDSGIDPRANFDRAAEEYRESIRVNPKQFRPHDNLGVLYVALAEHLLSLGQDPRATLQKAVAECRTALEIKPDYFEAWLDLGEAYRVRARSELERSVDSRRTLEEGAAAFRTAMKHQEVGQASAQAALVRLLVLELERRTARRENPASALGEAQQLMDEAQRQAADSPEVLLASAELQRWRAVNGSDDALEGALHAIDRLLEVKPGQAEALGLRAELLILRADRTAGASERRTSLLEAQRNLRDALAANRYLERRLGPQLTKVESLLAGRQQ